VSEVAPNRSESNRASLSINEVIAATGLCRESIYQAIRKGDLIARKYGKRTFVLSDDLRHFLASRPRLVLPATRVGKRLVDPRHALERKLGA
jgi:hypothetical protein